MKILNQKLIICDGGLPESIGRDGNVELLTHAEFSTCVRNGFWLKKIQAYQEVGMVVAYTQLRARPLAIAVVLRMLSSGSCWIMDGEGNITSIGTRLILRRVLMLLMEWLKIPFLLGDARREVNILLEWAKNRSPVPELLNGDSQPLYLKTDLWFSTQVGGSVTHMAGVVNNMRGLLGHPQVFSTASNPLLSADIRWKLILPKAIFWDFREIPALVFSRTAKRDIMNELGAVRPSFVYQRYSLNNYTGVLLAHDLAVPLVTEYNGSEVWISKNWGKPVALGDLSAQIELLNLHASALVVVVSNVLRDELIGRGLDEKKVIVNPNGVDVDFFNPSVDSVDLKESLCLTGKVVIGFMGTFGPWHGAERLVESFAQLIKVNQPPRQELHLLMVGDGVMRPGAQELADQLGVAKDCTFTGLVPQLDGPKYLACCDILVAPHVPNLDGSEFFGSPTKLFEYMAMGRPIVASRLGQIGEVLEHGRTGWLVDPGNNAALTEGLSLVLESYELRASMGARARDKAIHEYSWKKHVERIAVALKSRCS